MRESKEAAFGARIDCHTHVGNTLSDPPEVWETAIRLAQHYGIKQCIMLGNLEAFAEELGPLPDLMRRANDYTLAMMAHYPDFCIGFCYVNAANPPRFIVEEIERCVAKGGMKGIKLEFAVKATDRRLDPILSCAQTLGVPVLHHSWYNQTSTNPTESTPADIADLARRFPKVTIIMAHLGGARERGVQDVADLPNVLIDTAGSQPEAGLVEYALQKLGAERIVYGSDYPIRDMGVQLGRVLGAHLSAAERELILHGNVERVLGLA